MFYDPLFPRKEVECHCGCGFADSGLNHYYHMLSLREAMGCPVRVTSWCRCLQHNKSVGGKEDSSHLTGNASDILTPTFLYKIKLIFFAGQIGFTGIGVAKDFIHLDSDPSKTPFRFWLY